MHDVAPIEEDKHAIRLAEDVDAGRLTPTQAVRVAMAIGRIQGLYVSAHQLAHETGIVREFNKTRNGGNGNG
jgi:hypothetical protein